MRDWFLNHKKEVLFAVILVLAATASFGLGYLAARDQSQAPIIIETGE